jgi:hypothetical protein
LASDSLFQYQSGKLFRLVGFVNIHDNIRHRHVQPDSGEITNVVKRVPRQGNDLFINGFLVLI